MRFALIALALLYNLTLINAVKLQYSAKEVAQMTPSDPHALFGHRDQAAIASVAVKKDEVHLNDPVKMGSSSFRKSYDAKQKKEKYHTDQAFQAARKRTKVTTLGEPTESDPREREIIYRERAISHGTEAQKFRNERDSQQEAKDKAGWGDVRGIRDAIERSAVANAWMEGHEKHQDEYLNKANALSDQGRPPSSGRAATLDAARSGKRRLSPSPGEDGPPSPGEGSSTGAKRMKLSSVLNR
jgi:hypothetical protein